MRTKVLNEHPEKNNNETIWMWLRRHSVLRELYSFNKIAAKRTLDVKPTTRSLNDNIITIKYAVLYLRSFDFMQATIVIELRSIVAIVKHMLNTPNTRLFQTTMVEVTGPSMQVCRLLSFDSGAVVSFI
jgi:hypothetical protein